MRFEDYSGEEWKRRMMYKLGQQAATRPDMSAYRARYPYGGKFVFKQWGRNIGTTLRDLARHLRPVVRDMFTNPWGT